MKTNGTRLDDIARKLDPIINEFDRYVTRSDYRINLFYLFVENDKESNIRASSSTALMKLGLQERSKFAGREINTSKVEINGSLSGVDDNVVIDSYSLVLGSCELGRKYSQAIYDRFNSIPSSVYGYGDVKNGQLLFGEKFQQYIQSIRLNEEEV